MSVLCRDYVGIVSEITSVICRYFVGILSVMCRYFVGDYVGLPRHTVRPPLTVSTKEHPKRRPGSKVTAPDAPASHGIALVLQ